MVTTPSPQDGPDWRLTTTYATEIANITPPPGTNIAIGSFYVATSPALGFVAEITGTEPWSLYVSANNGETSLTPGIQAAFYEGQTDCVVHDNIPTAAAWLTFTLLGGTVLDPLTVDFWWWLSQTPEPGATLCLDQGLAINIDGGNCPHGTITAFYSTLLLPGIHNYCWNVNADLTGVVNLSGGDTSTLNGRMLRAVDPLADAVEQGQVIVSNIQPAYFVDNTGGGDVTIDAALTRGF